MRVVPVIDLRQGRAVHGVGGQRSSYEPVRSQLAETAEPADLAAAFVRLGLTEVYVADLDGIRGQVPDWNGLRQIAASGLRIWLDAGIGSVERAREVLRFEAEADCLSALIVGLESVPDPKCLAPLLECLGPERAVFSLDLKQERPLTGGAAWAGLTTATEIAAMAWQAGFRRLIVLDLAWVGRGQGVQVGSLCQELRKAAPWQLVAGGGVRDLEDLRLLAQQGCDAALVATALHNGRLSSQDLQTVRDW